MRTLFKRNLKTHANQTKSSCHVHVCTLQATTYHGRSCVQFLVSCITYSVACYIFVVSALCCFHTYPFNETKRTMHPPFRVQRFNIARSKKWNRNYIFKNVNYGWTLTQSYKRSYTCISECDMHFCFGYITSLDFNKHVCISMARQIYKNELIIV